MDKAITAMHLPEGGVGPSFRENVGPEFRELTMPVWTALTCNSTPEGVYAFLASGAGGDLNLSDRSSVTRTVVLKTGWSALSWGETIEVVVGGDPRGATVTFRGSANHPLNITANVQRTIERVTQALARRFTVWSALSL